MLSAMQRSEASASRESALVEVDFIGQRKTKEAREPRTIFSAVTPLIPADVELPATLSTIPEPASAGGSSHAGSMASRGKLTRCWPPSSVSSTSTR